MKLLHAVFLILLFLFISAGIGVAVNLSETHGREQADFKENMAPFMSQEEARRFAAREVRQRGLGAQFQTFLRDGTPVPGLAGWMVRDQYEFHLSEAPPYFEPPLGCDGTPPAIRDWRFSLTDETPSFSGIPMCYLAVIEGYPQLEGADLETWQDWHAAMADLWVNRLQLAPLRYLSLIRHMPLALQEHFAVQEALVKAALDRRLARDQWLFATSGMAVVVARAPTGLDGPTPAEAFAARVASMQQRQRREFLFLIFAVVLVATLVVAIWVVVVRQAKLAAAKQRLAHAVSHELRTPLASVLQLSEMLVDDRVPGEARRKQYIELIYSQGIRLKEMVERVLSYAGMENRVFRLSCEAITTDAVFEQFDILVRAVNPNLGGELHIKREERGLRLNGDLEALLRVFYNLLENAQKYGAPPYELRSRAKGRRWEVTFRDHGPGLSAKQQRGLFQPYVRYHQTGSGTGLGLSIVKELMRLHDGDIVVDETIEDGLAFVLFVPLRDEGGEG